MQSCFFCYALFCCFGSICNFRNSHDDVIKWKHFTRYWPFVRGIHQSAVNSPHKGQWRGALMFSLIYAGINGWVNNREAGDLRRHRVTVMRQQQLAKPTLHGDLIICSATWWRHGMMEAHYSPFVRGSSSKGAFMSSFDIFVAVSITKLLNKK